MTRLARWTALFAAMAALLLASCTTQTATKTSPGGTGADQGGANPAAGSTTGITANTINIAFIGVDFSALKSTGLVPDLGDQKKQVQSFVDDLNAHGGIDGHQIKLHFQLLNVLNGGENAIQAACISATQEFKAAVVILPPAAARDMVRCTAVTNQTLTIYATGMDDGLYTEAQGRLFTPDGMSLERQFRGWADEMQQLGDLNGRTVGVVAGDQPEEFLTAVNDGLIPELTKLGHKPAQSVTLPCATTSTSCDQYDAAAQKLKSAGVDTVFMTLANTFGPGLIQAADNIGYHPKWLLQGNQTTNTVLKFFKSVMNDINGSVGMGFAFALPSEITSLSKQCNQIVTERSGEQYAEGSDAYGFASVVCQEFKIVAEGSANVPKSQLNQGAMISGIAGLGTIQMVAGPDGTLSTTKHDGLDYMYLCDVSAATGTCVRRNTPPVRIKD
jgi:ABC-type branched-subunit amino acid transport system substrate-binding protein